jgi:hypothetical protein
MATTETICKFNQYGFCKFLSKCRKQHINDICSNSQCNSNTCLLRHPRVCKYFSNYQRCKFAEQCAYLHHSITIAETSSAEVQAHTQEVSELREQVKNLRVEVKNLSVEIDRLGKGTDARLKDAYTNQQHLLGMIKDLKEELDVDKAKRVSPEAKVEDRQQIGKGALAVGDEGDSRTCLSFPCMDTTCLEHHTGKGDIRIFGQAASTREESHGKDGKKGDKTGVKTMKKGKSAVTDRSFATNRTHDSYRGPGRGQK